MDALTGPDQRCCRCGSLDILAVQPGNAAVYGKVEGIVGLPIGILVRRPTPDRAWCAQCWGVRYASGVPKMVNFSRG
jgi:hypothetical protein